jgi:thiamine biosynthesis lipoprotein
MMGTSVRLTVAGDDRDAVVAAAEATLGRMSELEILLSRYRDDSEVSRLNTAGKIEGSSEALRAVLTLASRISELGEGAFDVSVLPLLDLYRSSLVERNELPAAEAVAQAVELVNYRGVGIDGESVTLERPGMGITLDGIGKGYIVDAGVGALRERGFANVFVDAGGDLMAAGDKGSGEPWRIGIRNPRPGSALQARFDTRNRAAATSGDYMQPFTDDYAQHHIMDPRTGYSAPEMASSTVIASDVATADALATLTMVLGPRRARALVEELPDCEGYFVSKQLEITRTSGFEVV